MKVYVLKDEGDIVGIFTSKEKIIELLKKMYPQKKLMEDYNSWEDFCEIEYGEYLTYEEYIKECLFSEPDCVEDYVLDKSYFI